LGGPEFKRLGLSLCEKRMVVNNRKQGSKIWVNFMIYMF
jgi:hypothetical protein